MSLKATSLAITWWWPSWRFTVPVKRRMATTATVTDKARMMTNLTLSATSYHRLGPS